MSRTLIVGLVDVFASVPLTGNPLAVVEAPDGLAAEELQAIAREFNQAETTFLRAGRSAVDWELRSFTAAGIEVFGAGHNALGAWLWLAHRGKLGDIRELRSFLQQIGPAVLPVHVQRVGDAVQVTMEQSPMTLGHVHRDLDALAVALGLAPTDLLCDPPPRVVDTGAGHMLVRVAEEAIVDAAAPDAKALRAAFDDAEDCGCYLYCLREGPVPSAYARFFNPSVGLTEDPATGSAAGPLAAYLVHQGLLPANAELEVEQGTLMGRRSILRVSAKDPVCLSGSGVVVMTGELKIG